MNITHNITKSVPVKILTLVYLFVPRNLADRIIGVLKYFNDKTLKTLKPHEILVFIFVWYNILTYGAKILKWIRFNIHRPHFVKKELEAKVFRFAMTHVPSVKDKVNKEVEKMAYDCTKKYGEERAGKCLYTLPNEGADPLAIVEEFKRLNLESRKKFAGDKGDGNLSGAVYTSDVQHWDFLAEVQKETIVSNPLHIDEFMYILQMEAEVIRWTLNLYNGDDSHCGVLTSGGTESIILACLSYRELGRKHMGIKKPNMVMSSTAHPAFDKAGFYLGIEIRKVPHINYMVDLEGLKNSVDSNTIALVASAPEYVYGNYDPVGEIAGLAKTRGIGCHVDCCLGSYVNPFITKLGYKLAYEYDFKVPGVTTISCDPHKYAYGPKGAGILMFKDKKMREAQFFTNTLWNGGIYATTCIAGSRPGSVIAGTWASMMKFGVKGLEEKARTVLEAQVQVKKKFAGNPDIQTTSFHDGPIVSFGSPTVNAIAIGELIKKRHGWSVTKLQKPPGVHWLITDASARNWEHFAESVAATIEEMKKDPSLNTNLDTAVYGMTGQIPDEGLLHQFVSIHQAAMLDTLR